MARALSMRSNNVTQSQDEVKRMFPQLADKREVFRRRVEQCESTTTVIKSITKLWWFPLKLTNGNAGRGFSWRSKHKERKELEEFFRGYFKEPIYPFGFPVELVITRLLGKGQRHWDEDSILRGNSKEIIDALVAVGWFHDDSKKWIMKVTGKQDASDRENGPAIEITVIRSGM